MAPGYLSDFGTLLLFLIGGALFILLGLFAARLIRPHRPNAEKLATFECGEEPVGPSWVQFNPRFYVIALIFIIFDVELAFMFPWAVVFGNRQLIEVSQGYWGWFALVEITIFIGILGLGLAYAWTKGHLDWIKPKPSIPESHSPVPADLYRLVNEREQARSRQLQQQRSLVKKEL